MARPRVREKLLDAAYALFRDDGAAALTTRGVAAKAGTTEASVFNNFGAKAGLLRALVNERLPQLIEAKDCVKHGDTADLRLWLEQVYSSAEQFYIAVAPLTTPFWVGNIHDSTGDVLSEILFPVHSVLCERLQALQQSAKISSSIDTHAVASLLIGAALHNALNVIARELVGSDGSQLERGTGNAASSAVVDQVYGILTT